MTQSLHDQYLSRGFIKARGLNGWWAESQLDPEIMFTEATTVLFASLLVSVPGPQLWSPSLELALPSEPPRILNPTAESYRELHLF